MSSAQLEVSSTVVSHPFLGVTARDLRAKLFVLKGESFLSVMEEAPLSNLPLNDVKGCYNFTL